jgi:hypothetical protein
MAIDEKAVEKLIAKDEIRELLAVYCRAIDRHDMKLLRSLYTKDGWDTHGDVFDGSADDFIPHLEKHMPFLPYTGHHVCTESLTVDGDSGEGEVYGLCFHVVPDGKGGLFQDLTGVRYMDTYRKEDGRWRFARRFVTFDFTVITPLPQPAGQAPDQSKDPSYGKLKTRLFARGGRA